MRISLDEAKKVILVAMYEYIYDNADSEYVELPAIRGACRTNLSLAFVSRVDAVLVSEQRLRTLTSGVHTYYTLTQKGWVDAESSEGLEELLSGLGAEVVPRAGEVPASDRVVTLNHNSDEYREVKVGLDELAEKLRQSNDIGELSAEEATVALKEVEDLSADLDRSKLRVGAFGLRARNSLQWIGSKAGESVIGQLATALMALILAYIGTLF